MTPGNTETILAEFSVDGLAFIVGPNHFQNSILATYIETHSKWKSMVIDSIADAPFNQEKDFPRHIAVLTDCFGLNGKDLENTLLLELEQLPADWSLALFNLERHTGIEKQALDYGVQGFFYQDDTIETLLKGLTAIFGGEFWASRHEMAEVILEKGFEHRHKQIYNHGNPHDLTSREVEILGLLVLGLTNEVISEKLFISPHTVRTHLHHIFKKISVSNRMMAANWASTFLFVKKHEHYKDSMHN